MERPSGPGKHDLPTEVAQWMERLYVGAPGATLRREDRRKAVEVAAMLEEIQRALARGKRGAALTVVDAAAGKAYVGLLAAKLVLERADRPAARVVTIERDAVRSALARDVALRLGVSARIECLAADVADESAYPQAPDLVAALHACGPAADVIIDRAVTRRAARLLLVPCCTGAAVRAAAAATRAAERQGIPRHAAVRNRFLQAFVDAERTLRLEAAGYETEVVELVPPTVTPHNLLWRARHVGEPRRMAEARRAHEGFFG